VGDYMEFGEKIKKARKKSGLTQSQLGDKLGVSASMLAQYETGKRNPKIETLLKISEAIGIPLDELIGLDNEEKQEKTSPDTEPPVSEEEKKEMAAKFYQWLIDTGKVKPGEDLTPQQLTGLLGVLDILDALF